MLARNRKSKRRSRQVHQQTGRRLVVERLEERRLLAGDLPFGEDFPQASLSPNQGSATVESPFNPGNEQTSWSRAVHSNSNWYNDASPFDVNNSGDVNLVDTFAVIDELRRRGVGAELPPEGPATASGPFVDLNQNGRVDLVDAFRAIDRIRFDGQGDFFRSVVVHNLGESPLGEHQVEVRLDGGDLDFGQLQPNGAGIRFFDSDSNAAAPHWMEDFDAARQVAVIMVAAPPLGPGESRTLVMQFGGPTATVTSDWASVFDPGRRDVVSPIRDEVADVTRYDAFPAAERLANGDLLVVFRGGAAHQEQDGRILIARSKDNGQNWSTRTIYDKPGIDDRVNLGLSQLSDGTLILPFAEHGLKIPERVFILRSIDNGHTWSSPIRIHHQFSSWMYPYGKVLERPDGTIELPVYGEYADGSRDISILQSFNQGDSWTLKSVVDTKVNGAGFGESSVVAINDRQYVAVFRDDDSIYQTQSVDGGVTWGGKSRLFDGVSPELLKLSTNELLLCVGDRQGVEGIRCHSSKDNGDSWSDGVMVATASRGQGPEGGYPATVELADGNLLTSFYYEEREDANVAIDRVMYSPGFVSGSASSGLVWENVEDGLSSWDVSGDSTTASNVNPHLGQTSLRIQDQDAQALNRATRTLYPAARSAGGVTFWAYLDSSSPHGAAFWLGDDNDRVYQIDYAADGSIRYHDQLGVLELPRPTSLALDQWHKFTFLFDTLQGQAELIINGESRGEIGHAGDGEIRQFGASSWGADVTGDLVYVDDVYTHSRENGMLIANVLR